MHWIFQVNGGPQRVNHSAVGIGDKIYSFGGYCSGENYRDIRPIDVHILNTATLKWHVFYPPNDVQNDAPFQRYGHTAVAHGTRVYVWGGRNDEMACNALYCFDTEHLKWARIQTQGSLPEPRDGHSACVINDHMYIFGGFEDVANQFSQEVYKLNLNTHFWSRVKTKGLPPSYRDFHTATAIDNRMFVFGGRGDNNAPYHSQSELYSNATVYLDVTMDQWHTPTTIGDSPAGRRSHSAFVHNGQIYIFGGYNSLIDMHFNDIHRFNPQTFTWQEIKTVGKSPSKRRRQSCVVLDSRMYLFGGTSPDPENDQSFVREDAIDNGGAILKDHDDLHILDFCPSLKTMCLMTTIQYKLDISDLPLSLQLEFKMMTPNNGNIQRIPSLG